METQQVIQARRTVRAYKKTPLDLDQINALLDAGRYAPSAGNLQNIRFIIVQDKDKKSKLADSCVQQIWMEEAPVHIVVVSDLSKAEEYYGDRGKEVYSRHNAAAAAQNILLCAHDMGLGSAWVGAFDEDMISRTLNIPTTARPEAVLCLGYANERVPIPPRYPVENSAFVEKWKGKYRDLLASMGYTSHKVKGAVESTMEKLKQIVK